MSSSDEYDVDEIKDFVKGYLEYCSDLETGQEVSELLEQEKYAELNDIKAKKRLVFRARGLHGEVGHGYGALNDLIVIQTAQGIVKYLMDEEVDKTKGVVIGFDNRKNSRRFAELIAVSFLLKEFNIHYCPNNIPTPFIPYAISQYEYILGIMVTGCCNTKNYNGLKVYCMDGIPISSDQAKKIQARIFQNLLPWPSSTDISLLRVSRLVSDPLYDLIKMYYEELAEMLKDISKESLKSLKVTFSALHGVSHFFVEKAFDTIGFENYFPVKKQMQADDDFPTVESPNPQEKNCTEYAMLEAEDSECGFFFVVDPDADRFAVAEKINNNKWHVFDGNEIAALLGSFLWDNVDSESKNDPSKCCMVASVVSSKILKSIAEKEGFSFYETLPGFEWVARKARDCVKEGMNFIFGFEESFEFMFRRPVLFKDAINASLQVLKLAANAKMENNTLTDMLKDIHRKYGYHFSSNSYLICEDFESVGKMFEGLRRYEGKENNYPTWLEDKKERFNVVSVRDLTTGFDSAEPDGKCDFPCHPSADLITFFFENSCEVTLMAKRSELRINYYSETVQVVPEEEWQRTKKSLLKLVKLVIEQWVKPEEYGFDYPQETDP